MQDHSLALPKGTQLDYFRIEAILGKGGFGITYEALDIQLGKRVAIKELFPDSIATRSAGGLVVPHSAAKNECWQWARERFLEEARVLASFSHPAIVGIHRIIEAHGTIYLIMDFVQGENYETRLRRIGCEPNEESLMAVVGPLLDGLREVHAKGLLHRDIKRMGAPPRSQIPPPTRHARNSTSNHHTPANTANPVNPRTCHGTGPGSSSEFLAKEAERCRPGQKNEEPCSVLLFHWSGCSFCPLLCIWKA